ncbi:ankyrin repeat domain-containing protein [Legionella gresilensis]|uniref:ankyrin repeat domain-containing protein n=1 Tax=Legionella gresilensis TaxID=91823 RepID=UPI001041383E|nr:ankyrin repeat domain-containing protein [Legionella gresilensis]
MTKITIYLRQNVAKQFGDDLGEYKQTLEKFINSPNQRGLNLEKLHSRNSSQPLYSIRHNSKSRLVLCPLKTDLGSQAWVVTAVLEKHEYNRLKKKSAIGEEENEASEAVEGESVVEAAEGEAEGESVSNANENATVNLVPSDKIEFINQQFILLDDDQQALKLVALPLIISGAPGSGKTSSLLAIIKHNIQQWSNSEEPPRILIIAKSERLVEQMRKEWLAMCKEDFQDMKIDSNWVMFQTPEEIYKANHPGEEVVFRGEQEFIRWYKEYAVKQNTLNGKKILPVTDDMAVLVYQELHTMSGYTSVDTYKSQVGNKFSLFVNNTMREELWKVYEAYQATLEKDHAVDVAFEQIELRQTYDFIGVDETQDLSRRQQRSIVQGKNGDQKNIVFCVGDHQRLFGSETTVPYIETLFREKENNNNNNSGHTVVTHRALHASYRCVEPIIRFANAILRLKYHATGGWRVGDKNELSSIKSNPNQSTNGNVLWLGDKNLEENEKKLNGLIDNNRDNVNFVVITSPEHMDEAIALFGQERVFTAKQMKGLQAKTVLLYRFFEQESFRAANKDLDKNLELQDNTTISKDSRGSIRHNNIFNELFVACTRAESDLIIYQPPVHSIQACISPLEKWVSTCLAHPVSNNQERVISTREEWLEQAQTLRKNGQIDQAEAIEARFATPLNDSIADPGQSITAVAPEIKPKLQVSTAKRSKKKDQTKVEKAPLSIEEQLDILIAKIINEGQAEALEQFLNFPFDKLKDYQDLSPEQLIAQNVAAKVLMAYLQKKDTSLNNLPKPFLSLLKNYWSEISRCKKPNKKQRDTQDTFFAIICYETTTGNSLGNIIKSKFSTLPHLVQSMVTFDKNRCIELSEEFNKGNLNVVFNLKRLGFLDRRDDTTGNTLLHFAVIARHPDKIFILLAADVNVNHTNWKGKTPLHIAAKRNYGEAIIPLIMKGATVDIFTPDGFTPLMYAVKNGYVKAIAPLLAAGANVNLKDGEGQTSLYLASWCGHEKIITALIEHGANVNAANKDGETPLFIAAWCGHEKVIEALIEHGANVNQARNNGETPLFAAALAGRLEVVRILLKVKDCNFKGREVSLRELLIDIKDYCIDIPEISRAAIQKAAIERAGKFVEEKKRNGQLSEKGKMMILPYEIAQIMGHKEISRLILEKMNKQAALEISHSSYSFYNHKNNSDNNNSIINDADITLPADTSDIDDLAPEADTPEMNKTISL